MWGIEVFKLHYIVLACDILGKHENSNCTFKWYRAAYEVPGRNKSYVILYTKFKVPALLSATVQQTKPLCVNKPYVILKEIL